MLPCWNLCYLQHNPSSPQIFLSFQILLLFIRHERYPKAFKLWNLTPLIRTYSCFDFHMCISSLFPHGLIHCNFHFFHNWSSFLLFPELIDEHSLMQLNTPSLHCPMCHHNFFDFQHFLFLGRLTKSLWNLNLPLFLSLPRPPHPISRSSMLLFKTWVILVTWPLARILWALHLCLIPTQIIWSPFANAGFARASTTRILVLHWVQ